MTDNAVRELWNKYLQGSVTVAELEQLRHFFSQPQYRTEFDGLLQEAFTNPGLIEKSDYEVDEIVHSLLSQIEENKNSQPVVRRMPFRRWSWAAASILLVASIGVYFWNLRGTKDSTGITQLVATEPVPPGGEGAILTLSDGRQLVLDSLGNGIIAQQKGSNAVLENGKLHYDGTSREVGLPVYNKMSTPRGRQFQMTLPDGSKVWLNAESSIRFPVAFTGSDRKVEVTGEAYFEVKKDAAKPFIVEGNDFRIDVLGTSFNINSYSDNGAVKATLVKGSIELNPSTGKGRSVQLKPGEQWVFKVVDATQQIIRSADISHALAWKEKRFSFNGNIRQIMNEVARWYNITLKYEGNIPDKELEGGFTREKELQQVLKILEAVAGVQFELKDKLLTIRAPK